MKYIRKIFEVSLTRDEYTEMIDHILSIDKVMFSDIDRTFKENNIEYIRIKKKPKICKW